jgi:MYXO-CTERM domain-containing protein
MKHSTSHIAGTLAVFAAAIAAALALTVAAMGATRPDDRAGVRGPGSAAAAQAATEDPGSAARPDNRAGLLGVASLQATDSVATSSGFDWTDAGIGAGTTAAALMLIGVGLLVAVPRRRQIRATA